MTSAAWVSSEPDGVYVTSIPQVVPAGTGAGVHVSPVMAKSAAATPVISSGPNVRGPPPMTPMSKCIGADGTATMPGSNWRYQPGGHTIGSAELP